VRSLGPARPLKFGLPLRSLLPHPTAIGYRANALPIRRFIIASALALLIAPSFILATQVVAADNGRTDVYVDCHTPDAIGSGLCSTFKEKIRQSSGYSLVDNTSTYGIGVHLSSVDVWAGIEGQLSGHMSAVSVVFTIFANKLPGEVYLDSSVSRVGKGAIPEMSEQMISAVGQQVDANSDLFSRMRTESTPSEKSLAPATP
jgi:hypothetical protein